MKIRISNYTFDASAKTITFTDYAGISLEGVLLVTNVTDNIIIYNFADATKGGTVATNVLTLDYDVTSMADADDLLIYYDDAVNYVHIEDVAHTSGDAGIMPLTVRCDDMCAQAGADGDYQPLSTNEDGILRTQAQQHFHVDECEATTGWTVLGNDTTSLATTVNHVLGTAALEFDKVNGAANTKIAGIQRTVTSFDAGPYHKGGGFVCGSFYLSSITDVNYILVRLGTNSSHYNEWRVDVDELSVGWNTFKKNINSVSTYNGNGWNSAAVVYVVVGVAFGAETDALADIAVDHIALNTGLQTNTEIIQTTTPNINLLKVGSKVVNTQAGDAGTGTQRVSISTDDVNLAAIKSAVEIIDDWDDTNYCNMNMNVAGTDIAANSGNKNAQTLRVVLATDDINSLAIKNAVEKIDDWEGAGNYADYCKSAMYIDNGSGSPIIALGDASGHLQVDVQSAPTTAVTGTFWQVTQPVSGTFWQVTQPVSIAGTVTVDLGGNNDVTVTSGAITETNSGTIAGDTTSIDGKITACNTGAVVLAAGTALIGDTTIRGNTAADGGGSDVWALIDAAGHLQIDIISGAITETNSSTIAGDTTSIDGKITACNTGAVVLAAGTALACDVGLMGNTVVDGSGSDLHTLIDAAGHLQIDVITAPTTAVTGTFWQVTQPVSIAATVTVDLGANNDVTVTSGTIDVLGDTAHDAADSGDPVKIGHKAVLFNSSAPPNAAAAENDRVNSIADEYGRQYVETTHPNYWDVSADYGAAQTNTTVKAAAGAGLSLYITDMVISNGAVAGNITLLDGSGGTVLVEIYPAINGGMSTNLRTPIKLTANTLLAITSTSCTTHSVMISGFIAP